MYLYLYLKKKNNMLPNYLFNKIVYVSDVQPYQLRNRGDFRLPFLSTSRSQNILFHKGFTLNNLPNELKVENNVIIFKKMLISYVKSNYC